MDAWYEEEDALFSGRKIGSVDISISWSHKEEKGEFLIKLAFLFKTREELDYMIELVIITTRGYTGIREEERRGEGETTTIQKPTLYLSECRT